MPAIFTRLHLFLFYSGLLLVFGSIYFDRYWLFMFLGGIVLSFGGLAVYWRQALA